VPVDLSGLVPARRDGGGSADASRGSVVWVHFRVGKCAVQSQSVLSAQVVTHVDLLALFLGSDGPFELEVIHKGILPD